LNFKNKVLSIKKGYFFIIPSLKTMENIISIECPVELLLSLHTNTEEFAELMKTQSAILLFKEGKILSGMGSTVA